MDSLALCVCVVLLFFKPIAATSASELLAPLLAPIIDEVCKDVNCGKGKCKASSKSMLLFECVCDSGWKQTIANQTDDFRFLPCVIPNCTLDYSCSKAPPPMPDPSIKPNSSVFDPCHWSQCGTGSCNKTSNISYDCLCPTGSDNLLNISTLPCLQSCSGEIGMDCISLGISKNNTGSSANPASAGNTGSRTRGNAHCLTITMIFVAIIFAKM